MKKATLLLIAILLFSGVASFAKPYISTPIGTLRSEADMLQVDFAGAQFTPSQAVAFEFDYLLSWDGMDFNIESISSGSITASVEWQTLDGTRCATPDVTISSGTPMTSFESGFGKLTLTNSVATTINVTGNIIIWND